MTDPQDFADHSRPSPSRWMSFTHLPSGHTVSTVMLDNDDPNLAHDFGTSVLDPDGTWALVERYSNEEDAHEGHLKVVARLAECHDSA